MIEIEGESEFSAFQSKTAHTYLGPSTYVSFEVEDTTGYNFTIRLDVLAVTSEQKTMGKGTLVLTLSAYTMDDMNYRIFTEGASSQLPDEANEPILTIGPNLSTDGLLADQISLQSFQVKVHPKEVIKKERGEHIEYIDCASIEITTPERYKNITVYFGIKTNKELESKEVIAHYGLTDKFSIKKYSKIRDIIHPKSLDDLHSDLLKKARIWDTKGGKIRVDRVLPNPKDKLKNMLYIIYEMQDNLYAQLISDIHLNAEKRGSCKMIFVTLNPFTNLLIKNNYSIKYKDNVENVTWDLEKTGSLFGTIHLVDTKKDHYLVHHGIFEESKNGMLVFQVFSQNDIKLYRCIWSYASTEDLEYRPNVKDQDILYKISEKEYIQIKKEYNEILKYLNTQRRTKRVYKYIINLFAATTVYFRKNTREDVEKHVLELSEKLSVLPKIRENINSEYELNELYNLLFKD